MKWYFEPVQAFEEIRDGHQQVFDEPLTPQAVQQQVAGKQVHAYLVKQASGETAGFAVYLGRGSQVDLWIAGVLPQKQRLGAGAFLIEQGEKEMAGKGYTQLFVNSYNRWNIMLSLLTRRGYRVVDTAFNENRADLKIRLEKTLRPRRELRYAITEICNFNCLFCHNEGLGHDVRREKLPEDRVLAVLQEAIALGHTDITLTGGEPLLQPARVIFLLNQFSQMPDPPYVTLVTNGSRLNDAVIQAMVDYRGDKKIHLSLHATDAPTFQKIARPNHGGMFEQVVGNIKKAAAAGLMVKVNHVVLQDINHTRIADAIDLAREMGAGSIKFLELLVLSNSPKDYRMYYDARAVGDQVAQIAAGAPEQRNLRQCIYRHRDDARFTMEVQRLTCALGCAHCRENRDRTLSSTLDYHPCFVLGKRTYSATNPARLKDVFKNGDRIIDGYAAKYGEKSPTLIQQETFIAAKQSEFLFLVADDKAFRKAIARGGFNQTGALGHHLEYYRPKQPSDSWLNCAKLMKIGWDHHDRSKMELVYTDHQYILDPQLGLETVTQYLDPDGPMAFKTAEKARHFLERLDFENYMVLEWHIELWNRKQTKVSLAKAGGVWTVKLNGPGPAAQAILDEFARWDVQVSPLDVPLPVYMEKHVKRNQAGSDQLGDN